MMRIIVALAVLASLSGCVSMEERRAAFFNSLDPFVGKTADELVLQKGVPTGSYMLSNGGKVLEYATNRVVTRGGGSMTVFQQVYVPGSNGGTGAWVSVPVERPMPSRVDEENCKIIFQVSPKNIVESWRSEGNACY